MIEIYEYQNKHLFNSFDISGDNHYNSCCYKLNT